MAGEIAEAFVRVRPNMEGFQSGVTRGVKDAFRDAAKGLAITFGVAEGARFFKEIVGHAADLQKQTNLVRDEFGKASEEIFKFAEGGAASLGISAHAAETTAGRFGILFKNIGVAPGLAAEMTVNFEKLAGSLSAIRGVDPSIVLKNLPLAVAGNLRSLKQLGIATDQTQLKIAAFKLGLTSSVTQALTPAQRAIAIYAVATKNLGDFQAQAAKHSGDLAQVDLRLRAEWDNAKDTLGKGLIPAAAALAHLFSVTLPTAVKVTRTIFRDLQQDINQLVAFIAPAFKPITDEIARIRGAIRQGGFGGGIDQIKRDFEGLSTAGKAAVVTIGAIAAAFALMAAAAFPFSATVLAVVGLGVAFREAYNHSARFRDIVDQIGTFVTARVVPAIRNLAAEAGPAFAQLADTAKQAFQAIATAVGAGVALAVTIWRHFGRTITEVLHNAFDGTVAFVRGALISIKGVFEVVLGVLTLDWSKAWSGLKDVVGGQLTAVEGVAEAFGKSIVDIFSAIWDKVKITTLEGVAAFTDILSKIPTSFKDPIFHKKIGFDNPFGGITESLLQQVKDIKDQRLGEQLAKEASDQAQKFATTRTRDPLGLKAAAEDTGKQLGDSVATHVEKGAKDGLTAGVKAGADAATAKAQSHLQDLQSKLHAATAKIGTDLANTTLQAKQNLVQIGTTLASTISQVIDEPFNVAAATIQAAQDKLALVFDKKNAALSAQQAQLSVLQAKLNLQSAALSREQARFSLEADVKNLKQLRDSVLLPGGKLLSENNQAAITQLRNLAKGNPLTAPSVNTFLQKFEQAVIQVQQDKLGVIQGQVQHKQDLLGIQGQLDALTRAAREVPLQLASEALRVRQDAAEALKRQVTRQINDLVEGITKGGNFTKIVNGITSLLAKHNITFKTTGALLGTAFADGFQSQVKGLLDQAKAITEVPRTKSTGTDITIVRPLTTLQKDTAAVHRLQKQIGDKQVSIAQKQLKAQQTANATLAKIHSVQLGPTAKAVSANPGEQSKTNKKLRGTTG